MPVKYKFKSWLLPHIKLHQLTMYNKLVHTFYVLPLKKDAAFCWCLQRSYTLHKKFKDICQYVVLNTKSKANPLNCTKDLEQEAQGLGALLDKMEDNDHIKLHNIRDLGVGAC